MVIDASRNAKNVEVVSSEISEQDKVKLFIPIKLQENVRSVKELSTILSSTSARTCLTIN